MIPNKCSIVKGEEERFCTRPNDMVVAAGVVHWARRTQGMRAPLSTRRAPTVSPVTPTTFS